MQQRLERQGGFTLVELMIVVIVVGILAAVAFPIYNDQVRKTRRTEARDALMAIAQAEERYYTEKGKYTTSLSNLDVASVVSCNSGTCKTLDNGYYTVTLAGSNSTFTATAQPTAGGAQAGDSCTKLTINQLGVKGGQGSGCW